MPPSALLRDIDRKIGRDQGFEIVREQLARQIAHWTAAASRLEVLENLASPAAWSSLERYLGIAVRDRLDKAAKNLRPYAAALRRQINAAQSTADLEQVQRALLDFRRRYTRVETALDFYADAINTRTNREISAVLRACDLIAGRSMALILEPLGKPTPPVLCYLDKGRGASILKAGLRLWDGRTENPAAAIKIVWHNLFRPTSLVHETGHQVAHIVGWNGAAALNSRLAPQGQDIADVWVGWTTELAGDAFAFAHTGYAAVAALHDVLAGDAAEVLRFNRFDPHPISYLRVLLGVEMCRLFFGAGPWDELGHCWTEAYPIEDMEAGVGDVIRASLPLLPDVVEVCLLAPMRAFAGRSLAGWVNPTRVSPRALAQLERRAGAALFVSHHWIWTEPLRLTALTGYRMAKDPKQSAAAMDQQRAWMLRLGAAVEV